jgi:TNF receptor-associated protein 1
MLLSLKKLNQISTNTKKCSSIKSYKKINPVLKNNRNAKRYMAKKSTFKEIKKPEDHDDGEVETGEAGMKFNPNNIEGLSEDDMKLFMEEGKKDRQKAAEEVDKEKQYVETIQETETIVGASEKHDFQAETKKILDIVARSLYTEKDVFIRELISNASDALEKMRHFQSTKTDYQDPESALEIRISVDPTKKTLTIQDAGIGMKKEDLIQNLGMIGHSGTKEFMKLVEAGANSTNLIGQFGVGFYSVFMVAHTVRVYSKHADNEEGYVWESDGSGAYKINRADGVKRGSKIVIFLKEECEDFSQIATVENIIKTYSNFVGYPIHLNGKRVNTIRALWLEDPSKITTKEHTEFYRHISKTFDSPLFKFHYKTDSPLSIRSLFYIPEHQNEKYGVARLSPGVNLYCKKVLIQEKCKGLLPEWLRFIKGVVDSEDIPLNISREHLQDSSIIRRLSNVLTGRILKYLKQKQEKDSGQFDKFYDEYSIFLKEGVCTDNTFKQEIAELLKFESSHGPEAVTLATYCDRAKDKNIYYLNAPNRRLAELSPYYEPVKKSGKEVLFLYQDIDSIVMSTLNDFKGFTLKSIESFNEIESMADTEKEIESDNKLSKEEFQNFAQWFQNILQDRVTTVTETDVKLSTPCIVIDPEGAAYRRMMKMMAQQDKDKTVPKQQVRINTSHPIIKQLNVFRTTQPELAVDIAEQIFDNALMQAGLLDDGRSMVPRLNKILERALGVSAAAVPEIEKKIDN